MGRPQFSTEGTLGGGQHLATHNRPELETVTREITSTVPASGGTATVEIFAPTGSNYNVQDLEIQATAPAGAGSGVHDVRVDPVNHVFSLYGEANFGTNLVFTGGHWFSADSAVQPTNEAAQAIQVKGLRATDSAPLSFVYENTTDADQNNTITFRLVVEEVSY